jgi:hypothetical protein
LITSAESGPGTIRILSVTESNLWQTYRFSTIESVGAYVVSNLPTLTNYWIKAFKDSDGDQQYTHGEFWGMTTNVIYLTNDLNGVNIFLTPEPFMCLWIIVATALFAERRY